MATQGKNKYHILFLVVIATLLCWSIFPYSSTGGDFFVNLSGVTSGFTKIFFQPMVGDLDYGDIKLTYRPIHSILMYIEYIISGSDPIVYSVSPSYQLTNLILQVITVTLVYLFALCLFQNARMAVLSGFIFAIWPGSMWVVPFIVMRPEILMAIFILITLISLDNYLETGKRKWQALAIMSSFFAYLSKGSAVVLIALVASYIVLKKKEGRIRLGELARNCLPFIPALVLYILLRIMVVGSLGKREFSEFILNRVVVLTNFFERLVYPIDILGLDQIIVFQYTIHSISILELLSLSLISLAVLYLFIKIIKKQTNLRRPTTENFLFLWIMSFLVFYMVYGKLSMWYIYIAAIPFSMILSSKLISSKNRILKISILLLIFYFILASPLFNDYTCLRVKSEIKREFIPKIVDAWKDIPPGSNIYLINYRWYADRYSKSAGVKILETKALLKIKFPEKNWNLIGVNDFIIEDTENFSIEYSLKIEDGRVTIMSEGKNIEFESNPEIRIIADDDFQVASIEVLNINRSSQIIILDNIQENDYIVMVGAKNSKFALSVFKLVKYK